MRATPSVLCALVTSGRWWGTVRKPDPTNVKDDEWEFVAPYLALIREDAPHREHDLPEICNALKWIVPSSARLRMIPNDRPRRAGVCHQPIA